MSALPPKADIHCGSRNVPIADIVCDRPADLFVLQPIQPNRIEFRYNALTETILTER